MGEISEKMSVEEEEEEEEEEEAQAKVDVWKYIFGFVEMAVVKCAIELGIADALESHKKSPMTLHELSTALGGAPAPLYRIMRFLVHRRIFRERLTNDGTMGYVQTPLSRRLMKRGDGGMAALLLLESSPPMLAPWHCLSACILGTGGNRHPFEAAHGEDVWSYAATHPSHGKLINDAMACDARAVVPMLVEHRPEVFEGLSSLVDVGGGNGTASRALVEAMPWIRAINFDLPHVVSSAMESEGVEHIGGDMLQSVPEADAALIMWVLHDWGDEECIQILKNCREAIPQEKGKVIILDAVIEEEKEYELKDVSLMLDMVMMAHTRTGKERTLKEWDSVLTKAGFSHYTVKRIPSVKAVIEAYP